MNTFNYFAPKQAGFSPDKKNSKFYVVMYHEFNTYNGGNTYSYYPLEAGEPAFENEFDELIHLRDLCNKLIASKRENKVTQIDIHLNLQRTPAKLNPVVFSIGRSKHTGMFERPYTNRIELQDEKIAALYTKCMQIFGMK